MPDLSMCPSDDCPLRTTCRRNEASGTRPNGWQTWSAFTWERYKGDVVCSGFWPVVGTGDAKEARSDGE